MGAGIDEDPAYPALAREAITLDFRGEPLLVCGLEHLLAMKHPLVPDSEAGQRAPDPAVRNYTLAAASHSSKLGPASFAPGLGSAAPSA